MGQDPDEVGNPVPFTPAISSSKQMQSEHSMADDMPIDVNPNAIHARFHAATMDLAGRAMANNTDRREKMADAGVGQFKTG
jgi:hypothetical protein